MTVKRHTLTLLGVLALGSGLGGCSFMRSHFGTSSHDKDYQKSVETRPLEVPPDLDTPGTAGALVIPAAGSPTAAGTTAGGTLVLGAPPAETAVAPATQAPATSAPPAFTPGPGAALGGDGLHVADTVESTWTRVGLALERSSIAAIQARDANGHSYQIRTTGETTVRPSLFKRVITLGMAGHKQSKQVDLTVRVNADGSGSKVTIEGSSGEADANAAHQVLEVLRARLS